MKTAILATILGLATAGCASTAKVARIEPSAPDPTVVSIGFRITQADDLPTASSEYEGRMKLLYEASPIDGMADHITDVVTLNCPETDGRTQPIYIGRGARQHIEDDSKQAFLTGIDQFIRQNAQNLERVVNEKYVVPAESTLFDYSKARVITLYIGKGPKSQETDIKFNPGEIAAEVRFYTESDTTPLRYRIQTSDATGMKLKKEAAKAMESTKEEKITPEEIKAGQELLSQLGNSYVNIMSKLKEEGYCQIR